MADKNILMQEFNRSGYDNLYPQIIPSFNQNVNLNSNRIVNVASPVNDNDGVNKRYVDMLQTLSIKKVGTITQMCQPVAFSPDDVLNCYGVILDYTLGVYSYDQGGGVSVGITDEYGNFNSSYTSCRIGGNDNKYQFSAKIFLEKNRIEAISGSAFDFNVSFDSHLSGSWVITHYHYFCCKGTSNTASENAPINMNIYFLM